MVFDIQGYICYCKPMKDVRFEIQPINSPDIADQINSAYLQPEREKRIIAMKRREAIAASLTGDWLARKLASELITCSPKELQISEGEFGKPQLLGRQVEISITHSGAYAAAAAAKRAIGIDLERLRPLPQTTILRVCSPEELNWVQSMPEKLLPRFFRLWTMKEAYGKMRGVGIFAGQRFNARFVEGQLIELYPDCLFLFPDAPDGYCLTLCIARE